MTSNRDNWLVWLSAIATLLLTALAAAPSLGPPFGKAIVEAFLRITCLSMIIVPATAILLAVGSSLSRHFGAPRVCLLWLGCLMALTVYAWFSIDPREDFRRQVHDGSYPSLAVIDRQQWTTFGDGSKWLFKLTISKEDLERLRQRLRALPIEFDDSIQSDDRFPDRREEWLLHWPAYQRPAKAVFYRSEQTLFVVDPASDIVFILDEQDSRNLDPPHSTGATGE